MDIAHADPRLAAAYERGNDLPGASLRAWAHLITSQLVDADRILEVGAGTGIFCAALAEQVPQAEIVGVDPSEPMLAEAARHHGHPRVHYRLGTADALPLDAGSCDAALLSRVVHHLPDRPAAARELARVLRPGGRVVIRTTVRERLDSPVYRYWPELLTHDARRFPAEAELLADFTGGGRFAVTRVFSFAQPIARNLAELRDRYALRAESKFGVLSEAEFAAGLARLDAAVSAAPVAGADGADGADGAGGPAEREGEVLERYDVVVLERAAEPA
ncbi:MULTISPECIES: class I SAM-dependent methyltransferase [Kitasatospora]|uniref:class I SAM-dependent methyltransferase n=1 Tax=Kitasatospora TaxID=2063 RepID=UPI000C704DCB|nr:class I SAM-dependent methyltransferase [Kitasatospora sp. GP30]MDH6139856.1 ubiquinone/menaquinone biosynthesis C-methylase UbiE [Kitasatospora sp. GP30]